MDALGDTRQFQLQSGEGGVGKRSHHRRGYYAVKMAAVFMISTSTLAMRTGFTPRWTAFLGFACALLLLLSGRYIDWILLVFPLRVLLISNYVEHFEPTRKSEATRLYSLKRLNARL